MTAPQEDEGRLDRIVTVPNAISLGRLACVPVFLWLLFDRENRVGAALLLAGLGATDWVDGYIARHFDQVSNLGKILDPIADRFLLIVGMVAILIDGSVPPVIFWAAVVREVLVAGLTLLLGALGARRIDVSWAGKAGTFLMMTAFPLFLWGHGHGPATAVAWPVAIAGLIMAWYAAATYVRPALDALREGRAAREGKPAT
ncbi:MAG TPA: CDP-alcohol phosphatidyltransferase family protein [Acidimicrobiales bacterium]|nr:CDP-alcohol phosphatidyltransferase family protein [Acidimicrobiales bacterium]